MAKTTTRRKPVEPSATESKVVDYAEELGRLIGTVRARVDGWGTERRRLVTQLTGVVKHAQALLTELGHGKSERERSKEARGAGRKSGRIPKHTAGSPEAKTHRLPATTRQKMEARAGRRRER